MSIKSENIKIRFMIYVNFKLELLSIFFYYWFFKCFRDLVFQLFVEIRSFTNLNLKLPSSLRLLCTMNEYIGLIGDIEKF